jgi:acyl carrier protein
MSESVQCELRAFIIENFLFGDTSREIEETTSLIENDLIDSTGILELVSFLEERYGFIVADSEIVPDNLDTIASITAYVSSKTDGLASTRAA